ncbi:MAG: DUF896 domain-containing protein [Clostridia bacterium]|nr:DUF896 domain-containing protein [Clostridia bacterium]
MEKKKLDRINELARKSKTVGLTDTEKSEQKVLRTEYLAEFRASFTGILDHTVIQYPDGSKQSLPEFREAHKKEKN